MDQFVREKCSFSEALEALKKGKNIRRATSCKIYMKREIICEGKTQIEYGNKFGRDDRFSPSILFTFEDVMADDWIIEEKESCSNS